MPPPAARVLLIWCFPRSGPGGAAGSFDRSPSDRSCGVIKAIAVTVLALAHEDGAIPLAAPLVGPELARGAAVGTDLAPDGVEVIDFEGDGAGTARDMVRVSNQPDPDPVA